MKYEEEQVQEAISKAIDMIQDMAIESGVSVDGLVVVTTQDGEAYVHKIETEE